MRDWNIIDTRTLHSHRILELQQRELACGDDRRTVLVMKAPDWINVIPLLDDGRVVLVRQWRYGIQRPTLEIPGGMVDVGEDSRQAAARELEEETGLRAGELRQLGFSHPNPAFLDNRLTTWLATDLQAIDEGRTSFGVDGEEIQRELVPLEEIPHLVGTGQISHALVIAAFYLFEAAHRKAFLG